MSDEQLIGTIIGAFVGVIVAYGIGGGRYRHVGGGWFEVVEDTPGCLASCLLEIVSVTIGAAAGFVVASLLAG
jgi:hypothetical protein